jgi:hypothetical protein
MILTTGEKMVWAAAFAGRLDWYKRDGPWNEGSGAKSADWAGSVVQTMRDAAAISEDHLEDERLQMLRVMLWDEE